MGISPLTGHTKPRFKMKTIAIVGGTGQTGKWAVEGALLRGYKVKVLARNPDKVTTVLKDLFDESEVEKHQENVTVVKGGISSVFIDRQQVAAAFLDSVESRQWDGKIVTAAK